RLHRANLIIGDVVHPFLMQVVKDAWHGETTEKDLDDVIRIIESYIFRRLMCQVAANALNTIFATAYSEIRKLRTEGQTYADLFTWILRRRDGGSGRFPNDADFRESFETRDCYRLRPTYRQYLFDVLENGDSKDNRDIADKLASWDLTVEHIMPQTLNHAWEEELGPNYEEVHDIWENRIGNLTISGYNSAYSNSSFQKKKSMPDGFNSSPYRLNADIKTVDRWTEEAMQERSKRLLQQAVDYWTFIETDFRPPEVVRPTEPLGDDTSFRGSVVTAYEYGDVSETVTDWAHLTPKVISILLEQNRAKLLEFANTEALLTTSPAERESERGMRMVDPSLGVFVNNNTDSKIELFRRVFEALDLDTEELVFTLRPPSTDSEKVFPAEPVVQRESTYSALTKFLDAVTEASVLKPSIEFTSDLRDELSSEFRPFHRESWLQDLNG